ncbi:hypothetical protein Tco_0796599 [Tanacetum coccineum]
MMSTSVFVDLEISTQADGAQSSRVPVPLPKDPYEAIRQAYLNGTDTESEPFEDPIETETPESPLTVAPPTSLPESTPPILVPILRRTARMAVRVPPAMSQGLSVNMTEVAAMSESVFCKRFRSSYESSPSSSLPDLPARKHYRGTPELVEDSEDDDEEVEESLDSDGVSEDAEDEGPTAEDEDPAGGDEGLAAGDEGPSIGVESHDSDDESRGLDDEGHSAESDGLGLGEEEEALPEGHQHAAPVVGTAVSARLGLGYGALRCRELALEEDHVYSTFEVGQGSGSAPESERPEWVSASKQATRTTWTDSEDSMVYIDVPAYPPHVQTPPSPDRDAGGLIRDHAVRLEELSPDLFKRYDRDLRELFTRPVLALESWVGQTDAQRVALWHDISDTQGENRELRLQLAKERRARLELVKIVDSMRRGQEPKGDV